MNKLALVLTGTITTAPSGATIAAAAVAASLPDFAGGAGWRSGWRTPLSPASHIVLP